MFQLMNILHVINATNSLAVFCLNRKKMFMDLIKSCISDEPLQSN